MKSTRYIKIFFLSICLFNLPLLALSQQSATLFAVNVKNYGAKGDGKSNDRGAFAKAITAINAKGGGKLIIPAGTYLIDAPIIIGSNTTVEGVGRKTIIQNNTKGSPWGNCIHIGYGREFSDWSGTFGKISDATLEQFNRKDWSKITTRNVTIRNLRTKTNNLAEGGLGIFALNAQDILIENITGDGNATPVNIGNDGEKFSAACRNVKVRNISNINPGRWYDLVFVGQAENVEISNCTYKFSKSSKLNEIITIGGQNCRVYNNYIEYLSKGKSATNKKGIDITAPKFGFTGNNIVENNTIVNLPVGITVYNSNQNIVRNNSLRNNKVAMHIYSKSNAISKNNFSLNNMNLILETDASRGSIENNKGLDLKKVQDKASLLKTYKIKEL